MSDADWVGLDQKAIRLSLTKNVAFNILKEKTTKGIMEALSNIFWTLKDVRVVSALKKSLISIRQLDDQGHEVKFRDGKWKVVKGNLVMARGKKRGSLYMVELPSEGVTVPVQKRNKLRFTESHVKNKVVYAKEKPRVTGSGSVRLQWEPLGTEDESERSVIAHCLSSVTVTVLQYLLYSIVG
ncbi:unnamed protein product [Cuscuta campestris]|uniref:Uncharacterized protein n=1 Tax=Cuscuta campestris TaxID=132261 RepID=A0A484L8S0_9ASTE|nr:unnamed protein product [Cuscuta campestris]